MKPTLTLTTRIRMLSAKDLAAILGSRALAYKLFNTQGFPVIELGKRKFVREDRFEEWTTENEGKRIELAGTLQ